MSKIVIKSYYVIKIKGYAGQKDKYIANRLSDKKIKFTDELNKATRIEYFGLKGMDKSLMVVMDYISELKNKGAINTDNISIVGGDIYGSIESIEDESVKKNMLMWSTLIDDQTAKDMVDLSIDEDGEPTENFVYVHKFLSHVKRLNFNDIIEVAQNWDRVSESVQANLAVGYAGNYNASRFIIFMDYLSREVVK